MKTLLLAAAIVAAPGAALAQYEGRNYGGGWGPYAGAPSYGTPSRVRNLCRTDFVAVSYDYYGRPVYRRRQVCELVQY